MVKLSEPKEKATARLAQLAIGLGLSADQVSLKDGFFRGQRTRLDQWATDDLYDRDRSLVDVVRRLEITVVAGDGSATLSPRVIRCRRGRGGDVCDDAFTDLEQDELLILDKLMRVLMPAEVPASSTKPSTDI